MAIQQETTTESMQHRGKKEMVTVEEKEEVSDSKRSYRRPVMGAS